MVENNNFSLLRLVMATLVVLGHFQLLAANLHPQGIYGYVDFAVDAFFIISGYLVSGSFDRSSKFGDFYIRRFFRIYPLYFVVVLLQGLAMFALLANSYPTPWSALLGYLGSNLIFANFMHHDLGGLLFGTPNDGINPSLWTLKIEVLFYLILPFIWILLRRYGFGVLVVIYIASTIYTQVALAYDDMTLAKQLPGQLRFFSVGIALYCYRDILYIPSRWVSALTALGLVVICSFRHQIPIMPVYPILMGFLVFICAQCLPILPVKNDISYGVYLFHGPLIQLSLLIGWYRGTLFYLTILLVTVYTMAFAAERLIEIPGINLGKKLARRYVLKYNGGS